MGFKYKPEHMTNAEYLDSLDKDMTLYIGEFKHQLSVVTDFRVIRKAPEFIKTLCQKINGLHSDLEDLERKIANSDSQQKLEAIRKAFRDAGL